MDFSLTEDQVRFKGAAIDFARRELNGDVREREKEGVFHREGWNKCAVFGIQGFLHTKRNRHRLIIGVNLLQQGASVEIDADEVVQIDHPSPNPTIGVS